MSEVNDQVYFYVSAEAEAQIPFALPGFGFPLVSSRPAQVSCPPLQSWGGRAGVPLWLPPHHCQREDEPASNPVCFARIWISQSTTKCIKLLFRNYNFLEDSISGGKFWNKISKSEYMSGKKISTVCPIYYLSQWTKDSDQITGCCSQTKLWAKNNLQNYSRSLLQSKAAKFGWRLMCYDCHNFSKTRRFWHFLATEKTDWNSVWAGVGLKMCFLRFSCSCACLWCHTMALIRQLELSLLLVDSATYQKLYTLSTRRYHFLSWGRVPSSEHKCMIHKICIIW